MSHLCDSLERTIIAMVSGSKDCSDKAGQIRIATFEGTTKKVECLDPWLDDGNIVLVVAEKGFRVHRTILASYSEVFKHAFALPHSNNVKEDVIEGCPVVYLNDAVDDLQIMLRALYNRGFIFFYGTPMPVSVLAAFLRMGKKYEIEQLFEEAKRSLSDDSPPLVCASNVSKNGDLFLFPGISDNDPHNFTVMNIAHEARLHSTVVIATFYASLTCPPSCIIDGYEFEGRWYTLSPFILRYYLLGKQYLTNVERQMTQSLAHLPASCCRTYHVHDACASTILSRVHSFQELGSPFSVWAPVWDYGLCGICRAELRKRHEEARTRLWKEFPVELGLGPWEDLDRDSGISDAE